MNGENGIPKKSGFPCPLSSLVGFSLACSLAVFPIVLLQTFCCTLSLTPVASVPLLFCLGRLFSSSSFLHSRFFVLFLHIFVFSQSSRPLLFLSFSCSTPNIHFRFCPFFRECFRIAHLGYRSCEHGQSLGEALECNNQQINRLVDPSMNDRKVRQRSPPLAVPYPLVGLQVEG